MGQPGFFDLQHRYEGLDAKSDPLVAILAAVPFELFRVKLKTALVKGGLQLHPEQFEGNRRQNRNQRVRLRVQPLIAIDRRAHV